MEILNTHLELCFYIISRLPHVLMQPSLATNQVVILTFRLCCKDFRLPKDLINEYDFSCLSLSVMNSQECLYLNSGILGPK